MANAKICDRCGEFYKNDKTSDVKAVYISFSQSDYINGRILDLCPDCRESLSEWYRMDNSIKAMNM